MAAAEPTASLVERLFAEHRAALQTFFLRRIRSKADAGDLAREVYVRILRISDRNRAYLKRLPVPVTCYK